MLTLEGNLPTMGSGSGSGMAGAGLGAAGGILGGGVAGLLGGALAGAFLGNRNNNGWGNGNGYGGPATAAVATDLVIQPAFTALQQQITALGGQVAHDSLANTIEHESDEVTDGLRHVDDQITAGFAAIQNAVGTFATASAAMNFTTLQSINGLGRDVVTQANQNALQQLNSFNQLNTTTLQGFNQAAFNNNIATQQIIAGQTLAAATAAQCCCDIKQLILSDGNLTRALINANTMQDLRDKNVELSGEVSNFRQSQFIINKINPSVVV